MTRSSIRGMTLVEVLIASSVFAMVMLALATAFSTFGKTYTRLSEETAAASRVREVDQFVRKTMRSALSSPGLFQGSASAVSWVAPIDRIGGAGGLQHIKLLVNGDQLVLRFAPFSVGYDGQTEPSWASAVPDVALLDGLDRGSLSYKLYPDSGWQAQYESVDGVGSQNSPVPWAVKLEWAAEGKEWPPVITRLERYGMSQ